MGRWPTWVDASALVILTVGARHGVPVQYRWGVTLRGAVGVQGKGQGPISADAGAGRRHFGLLGVVWLGPGRQLRRVRPRCSHFSALAQFDVEAALRRHLAS